MNTGKGPFGHTVSTSQYPFSVFVARIVQVKYSMLPCLFGCDVRLRFHNAFTDALDFDVGDTCLFFAHISEARYCTYDHCIVHYVIIILHIEIVIHVTRQFNCCW